MALRAANAVKPDRYVHEAVTAVAKMRSSAYGSVVYSSRGYPENAESVVFRTTRFARPETTVVPAASRVTTDVHCSPPGWTNAWSASRVHGCSVVLTRTLETALLSMKWSARRDANAS